MLTRCHPTGHMIFHLSLRTSGIDTSSRLLGPGPQWTVMSGDYYDYCQKQHFDYYKIKDVLIQWK